jgi:hypothetical protein
MAGRHSRVLTMDRAYWTKMLHEAEAELEAAQSPTEVAAATKKLLQAKAELRKLEEHPPAPLRADRRRDRWPGSRS